jgi:TolA-binding protein
MKNGVLLSLVAALFIATGSASMAATQSAHPTTPSHSVAQPAPKLAPVDEYFGKMKLSPLGINNTIHDASVHVKYDQVNAGRYYTSLEWAEDALHDWAHKYPQDTWLPGRAYFMSHVFWQMHTAEADAAAGRCRSLLFTQFPKSHWTVLAKRETKDKVAPVVSQAAAVTKP